jgi:hypothetical protein
MADRSETSPLLWLSATGSLCEAACDLADADGAARLLYELSPYADHFLQWTFTGNAGCVRRLLGRAAALAGRRDDACRHFEAALVRHSEAGAPALLARTRRDYGELLLQGSAGDQRRAHRLLDAAVADARRLGMRGVALRADRHG